MQEFNTDPNMHHKGFPNPFILTMCLGASLLISLVYWWPMAIAGVFIIPIKLMTGWDGTTGVFGNRKHTVKEPRWTGFWTAWNYLALRNPVSNCSHDLLAMVIDPIQDADIWGFTGVTDGPAAVKGWYFIITPMGAWEFRLVWPSLPGRCLEIRVGWKINGYLGGTEYHYASFVCRVNPWRKFG